jgi:hypothetical protein
MNLTTSSVGTAVGLSSDLSTGIISRFRTLPMRHSAILAGRTLSDLLASVLCGTIVVLTGLLIGWRPGNGLLGVIAGLSIAVLFAYAMSWANACVGLSVGDPESAGDRLHPDLPARAHLHLLRAFADDARVDAADRGVEPGLVGRSRGS